MNLTIVEDKGYDVIWERIGMIVILWKQMTFVSLPTTVKVATEF